MFRGPHLKQIGSIYRDGTPGVPNSGTPFIFLIQDHFTPDAASPLSSPRRGDGGGAAGFGYWYIKQNANNTFGLEGSRLHRELWDSFSASLLALANSSATPQALSPRAGLAMYVREAYTRLAAGFGDDSNNPSTLRDSTGGGGVYNRTIYANQCPTLLYPNDGDIVLILRSKGGYLFSADGTLLWVWWDGSSTPVYAMLGSAVDSDVDLTDKINVARLPGSRNDSVPGNGYAVFEPRDLDLCVAGSGTGTSYIAAPIVGDTFVHTPDFVLEFDIPAITTTQSVIINFRHRDADNFWRIRMDSSGDLDLDKRVGGVTTNNVAVAGGVLTGGEHITLIAHNATLTAEYNGNVAWVYGSATELKSEAGGSIIQLGDGVLAALEAKTLNGVYNDASPNFVGYGLATDILPGPIAASTTFFHEADCNIEWMQDAIPTALNTLIVFRIQDATNYWVVDIDNAGNLLLREVVGGVSNTRGTAAAALAGGERIVITADDETIRGYYDSTLAWTYASAASFKTETDGEVDAVGTNGWVSHLITRPLDFSAPNSITPGSNEAFRAIVDMRQ